MSRFIIAADIGGTHISSAIVDTRLWQIHADKVMETKVDSFGDKDSIVKGWVQNLLQSAREGNINKDYQIAIALPGPFDYRKGIFHLHPEGKLAALAGENFRDFLVPHFGEDLKIIFENDAACFGLGAACFGSGQSYKRSIGITLGTGIGSSFIADQKIIRTTHKVPSGGEVYALPFLQGIADDYFSTRWFVRQTELDLGLKVSGVRDLLQTVPPTYVDQIFMKFCQNFYQFLSPYAKGFGAEAIIIGGNITKGWDHFGEKLTTLFAKDKMAVLPSKLNEHAIILGAAKVFNDTFFTQM